MKELVVEIAKHFSDISSTLNFDINDAANSTIFVGELTDTLESGVMLIPVPSPPPHDYVDTEYIIIDFWARSPHTDGAMSLLREVFNTYGRRYHFDTPNWHIYWSRNLGSIMDASRDGENSKLMRLSVQFICRNLNNVS